MLGGVVSDSLESSYWADAESLVVAFTLSQGEQRFFPCPACSEPRLLKAARLFLRSICSVLLIRKISQSGEWKRLVNVSNNSERKWGGCEAAESRGEQWMAQIDLLLFPAKLCLEPHMMMGLTTENSRSLMLWDTFASSVFPCQVCCASQQVYSKTLC